MRMTLKKKNKKDITIKDLRQFAIVLGMILWVFGCIHLLNGRTNVYPWFFGFGGMSLLLGMFLPKAVKPVFIVFTKVAHLLGWFNTRVILILVYYMLLTPIGIIMKIFRKDNLRNKIDKEAESYWLKRENTICTKESLEKQF